MRTSYRFLGRTLVAGVLLGLCTSCGRPADPAAERLARAERGAGDIVIGAAWPWAAFPDAQYRKGLELAVAELNAAGGVLGRPLRLQWADDQASINTGRLVAQAFANDPDVVAVVGHLQSYVSVAAAAIYDLYGLVMVSPSSTSPELTEEGYRRVFRTTFNDKQVGAQMADVAARRGFERIAILYIRNTYGRDLANAFEERAAELGMTVVTRQSYTPASETGRKSFETVLKGLGELEFDAIFLAGEVPEAAQFIVQARARGLDVPVLGGDAMDAPDLLSIGGPAAEGVIVASTFHEHVPRAEVQQFIDRFRAAYGTVPDGGAVAGYDAVRVLAHAMEQAGTTVPDRVADALRALEGWPGVTGAFTFQDNGDLDGKVVIKKFVHDGAFHYMDETMLSSHTAPRP